VAREQWTVKFAPTIVSSIDGLTDRVAKVVGVSDDLEAVKICEKEVQEACGTNASAARSQPYYLDVTHPQANKGEVVLVMSSLLKIPLEAIATIGDMPNDVLMFKKSGISIAMGNASDEVQKSATYVARTKASRTRWRNSSCRATLRRASPSFPIILAHTSIHHALLSCHASLTAA
jgi:hydroxymethylpyrimidine pyrophosphatase-like HAD family hydrolase